MRFRAQIDLHSGLTWKRTNFEIAAIRIRFEIDSHKRNKNWEYRKNDIPPCLVIRHFFHVNTSSTLYFKAVLIGKQLILFLIHPTRVI